jgi:hypothetical protein
VFIMLNEIKYTIKTFFNHLFLLPSRIFFFNTSKTASKFCNMYTIIALVMKNQVNKKYKDINE